jgi:hypothetical protein
MARTLSSGSNRRRKRAPECTQFAIEIGRDRREAARVAASPRLLEAGRCGEGEWRVDRTQ